MAIQIKNTYSGRTDNTDPNYPYGKGRNVVGGVEGTGTPFEADWYNNLEGFLQGLLVEAGIVPDGSVDTADSSQLVEAVKGIIWGERFKGTFEQGFTYTSDGDVGLGQDGKFYKYVGEGAPNKVVVAGTVPSVATGYEQVTFNDHSLLVNRNSIEAHDNFEIVFDSTATLSTGALLDRVIGVSEVSRLHQLQKSVKTISFYDGWVVENTTPIGGATYIVKTKAEKDSSVHSGFEGITCFQFLSSDYWFCLAPSDAFKISQFGVRYVENNAVDLNASAFNELSLLHKSTMQFDVNSIKLNNAYQVKTWPGMRFYSESYFEIKSHSNTYGIDILPLVNGVFPTSIDLSKISVRMLEGSAKAAWRIKCSYSNLYKLSATVSAVLSVDGFHFEADDSGSGPYYNLVTTPVVQGAQNGLQENTGVKFTSGAGITTRYPNANTFIGGRVGGCNTAIEWKGNGNYWYSPTFEGTKTMVADFSGGVASGSVENKIINAYVEGATGTKIMRTDQYSRACGFTGYVTSTGGAGQGSWEGDKGLTCHYNDGVYNYEGLTASGKVFNGKITAQADVGSADIELDNVQGTKTVIANTSSFSESHALRIYSNDIEILRAGPVSLNAARDNVSSLGTAVLRWNNAYVSSGVINTSDENLKEQISELSDKEAAVAIKVKGLVKRYKFRDAVAKKGEAARWHFGVIAQEVKEAFEGQGLNPFDYGVLCYDEWEDIFDEDGNLVTEKGGRYGVRYEELLCFIISTL